MKNPVNFFDAELINGEWWFSNLSFNALMKTNSESGETEMISTFEDLPADSENLHVKTIRYDNLLIFIPHKSNRIHIWDIEKNCFLKSVAIEYEKSGYFINAFKDDNDIIWIIPNKLSDSIILFDINKREVSAFDGIKELSDSGNADDVIIWADYKNNNLYIQIYRKNICFSVECNSGKTEKIIFPDSFLGLPFSVYDNKLYLSLLGTSDIFEYDTKTKSYERYKINGILKRGIIFYSNIIKVKNKLIITPCHSDDVIIYDTEKREYKKLTFPEGFERTGPYNMCGFYKMSENEIIVFPARCNQLIKINTDDFSLSTMPFVLSDSLIKYSADMTESLFEKKYHSGLNEDFAYKETLGMFIDKLVSEESNDKKSDDENAGEKIHNYIVSLFE